MFWKFRRLGITPRVPAILLSGFRMALLIRIILNLLENQKLYSHQTLRMDTGIRWQKLRRDKAITLMGLLEFVMIVVFMPPITIHGKAFISCWSFPKWA